MLRCTGKNGLCKFAAKFTVDGAPVCGHHNGLRGKKDVEDDQVSIDGSDDCAICWCPLKDGALCMTKCKHNFHMGCMTKWLDINRRCPMCRSEVAEDGVMTTVNVKIDIFEFI